MGYKQVSYSAIVRFMELLEQEGGRVVLGQPVQCSAEITNGLQHFWHQRLNISSIVINRHNALQTGVIQPVGWEVDDEIAAVNRPDILWQSCSPLAVQSRSLDYGSLTIIYVPCPKDVSGRKQRHKVPAKYRKRILRYHPPPFLHLFTLQKEKKKETSKILECNTSNCFFYHNSAGSRFLTGWCAVVNKSIDNGADGIFTNQMARKLYTTPACFIRHASQCNTAKISCEFANNMLKNEFPPVRRGVDSYLPHDNV